jgi:hypothetical protein
MSAALLFDSDVCAAVLQPLPPLFFDVDAAADDAMPHYRGHPVGATGFRNVTTRVYDTFAAYITAARQRVWIGTFRTIKEVMCAYDATAWRFGCARSKLNFPDIESVEEAQFLVPPPDPDARGSA